MDVGDQRQGGVATDGGQGFGGFAIGDGTARDLATGLSQRPDLRITSYNVCYTKLLRVDPDSGFLELLDGTGKVDHLTDCQMFDRSR